MRQNTNRTETMPCKPRSGDRTTVIRMKRHRSGGNPYRIIATLFRASFSRIRLSILLSVVSRQQTIPNDAFGLKIRSDEQKQSRSHVLSEKSGPPRNRPLHRPPPRMVDERHSCRPFLFAAASSYPLDPSIRRSLSRKTACRSTTGTDIDPPVSSAFPAQAVIELSSCRRDTRTKPGTGSPHGEKNYFPIRNAR